MLGVALAALAKSRDKQGINQKALRRLQVRSALLHRCWLVLCSKVLEIWLFGVHMLEQTRSRRSHASFGSISLTKGSSTRAPFRTATLSSLSIVGGLKALTEVVVR